MKNAFTSQYMKNAFTILHFPSTKEISLIFGLILVHIFTYLVYLFWFPFTKVDKIEDSISEINARAKPLAAYVFTNNKMLKEEFIKNVSAGGLVVNDTTLHVSLPSGVIIVAETF